MSKLFVLPIAIIPTLPAVALGWALGSGNLFAAVLAAIVATAVLAVYIVIGLGVWLHLDEQADEMKSLLNARPRRFAEVTLAEGSKWTSLTFHPDVDLFINGERIRHTGEDDDD